ncbi:MAG: response regulator transcription factor [Nitrospirota bacterium]|nr:response regulator transcription factor [Nitrospirota bacterium]
MRVLVVEDEETLRTRLHDSLAAAGYAVDATGNGASAEILGDQFPYDAVVLDLGLPGKAGLDVLKAWRRRRNLVPVIVLTARGQWHEKVDGFSAGADDYLGKPFHMPELIARLGALVRRSQGRTQGPLTVGGVALDEETQQVAVDGTIHRLTGVEFRLLRALMLNRGRVLSKERLEEHVYDMNAERGSNVIEVYIKRLRDKVGRDMIQTRRGQGYVFGGGGDG